MFSQPSFVLRTLTRCLVSVGGPGSAGRTGTHGETFSLSNQQSWKTGTVHGFPAVNVGAKASM